jgi:hypothetical protein
MRYRLRNRATLIGLAFRGKLPASRVRQMAFALSGGVIPLFQSGAPEFTMTTTVTTVVAGQVVEVTGDRSIGPAAASSLKSCGVAKQTASAIGDKVGVASGGVWLLKAAGAITAGDHVRAGALGTVTTIAADGDPRLVVGIALAGAADTALAPILLKLT